MKPVSPVTPNVQMEEVAIAKHQPEYQTLPAVWLNGGQLLLSRWEITDEDLELIKEHRSIWLSQLTHGAPIQPISLSAEHPIISFASEDLEWSQEVFEDSGTE